jgi:hypothetical protein
VGTTSACRDLPENVERTFTIRLSGWEKWSPYIVNRCIYRDYGNKDISYKREAGFELVYFCLSQRRAEVIKVPS